MKDPIVQEGAPVLRQKAAPVPKKDLASAKVRAIIEKMKKALSKEEFGVAIAAPQVGESLRIFVVAGRVFEEPTEDEEAQRDSKEPDRVYINPELTRLSRKKAEMSEGCLSVRGKYGTVMRHEKASLKAWNEQGEPVHLNATGLLAHIFQHECDHLEGVLYTDKAVRLEEDDDMKRARTKVKEKHGV